MPKMERGPLVPLYWLRPASSSCSAFHAVGNKTGSLRSSCSVTRLLSCAVKLFVPPCGRQTEQF
jgi:hypothetical protein